MKQKLGRRNSEKNAKLLKDCKLPARPYTEPWLRQPPLCQLLTPQPRPLGRGDLPQQSLAANDQPTRQRHSAPSHSGRNIVPTQKAVKELEPNALLSPGLEASGE